MALPTPTSPAHEGFFEIPEPYSKEFFLRLTEDALEIALTVFAPCGVAYKSQALLSASEFMEEYAGVFHHCVDMISRNLYQRRGAEESRVAATLHEFAEVQQDQDVIKAMKESVEALKHVYNPPAVVELPLQASAENTARALQIVLFAWQRVTASWHALQQMDEEVFRQLHVQIPLRVPAYNDIARWVNADVVDTLLEVLSSLELSHEQFVALIDVYQSEDCVKEVLQQFNFSDLQHAKARTELAPHPVVAYRDAILLQLSPAKTDAEPAVPREVKIRALELVQEAVEAEERARTVLACHGGSDTDEVTKALGQCLSKSGDLLPASLRGKLLATHAKCLLEAENDPMDVIDDILSHCSQAVSLDPGCLLAYQVRAQALMFRATDDPDELTAAATDVMRAFLLGGGANAEEAGMVEELARDAVRQSAKTLYAQKERVCIWPHDWTVRSYFSSYTTLDAALRVQPAGDGPMEEVHTHRVLNNVQTTVGLVIQQQYFDAYALVRTLESELVVQEEGQRAAGAWDLTSESKEVDSRVLARALNLVGSFRYLTGQTDLAVWAFETSCKLDPSLVDSFVKLAAVYCELDEQERTLELLQQAESMDPRRADTHLHRAHTMLQAGQFIEAVRELLVSRDLDADCAATWATLGVAQFKSSPQEPHLAKDTLREAVERFPRSLEAWLYYGEVLAQTGDVSTSMSAFRTAALLDGTCPLPFVNAGRAYCALQLHNVAMKHLEKALALDPSVSGTHVDMGQALLQAGCTEEAMSHFELALASSRYVPEFRDALSCKLVADIQLQVETELGIKRSVHY